MHPVLAHYLNFEAAIQTLDRSRDGSRLEPSEQCFAEAAQADDARQALLLAARGKKRLSEEAQSALVILAAHAAALSVRSDTTLGPLLATAREALAKEGASPADSDRLLVALVLEEGFGPDAEADAFDRDYFQESLELLPNLASMTQERAEALIRKTVDAAEDPTWAKSQELVAESLLRAAWEEGLEPIHPEHLEEALETCTERLGENQAPRIIEAASRFLDTLEEVHLIGPLRRERLDAVLRVHALRLGSSQH